MTMTKLFDLSGNVALITGGNGGIGRSIAIAFGWFETDTTAPVKTLPLNDEIIVRTRAGCRGKTEELAKTVVYLASSASDFVTGETIRVDGGYAIG